MHSLISRRWIERLPNANLPARCHAGHSEISAVLSFIVVSDFRAVSGYGLATDLRLMAIIILHEQRMAPCYRYAVKVSSGTMGRPL